MNRRGIRALAAAMIGASVMIVGLAGCAASDSTNSGSSSGGNGSTNEGGTGMPDASTLTLDAAKSLTIQRRDEIAALFPAANVADLTATTTSKSLLPCDTADSFGWPGRATITLSGEFDHAAALAPIASKYESSDGWTVARGTTDKGNPTLDLDNVDGTHVHVGYYTDGTELWIDAVSPCFALPGGYAYGTQY